MSAMKPSARMAAILALVRAAPDQLLASSEIWALIPDYDRGEPSGRRLYRLDLRALVNRGLVEADVSTDRTPRRTGVRARFVGKPEQWELTSAEHHALRLARRRRPGRAPSVTEGRDGRGTDLDVANDALRVLEESGEWMSGAEVAAELGCSAEQVIAGLAEIDMVEVGGDCVLDEAVDMERFDEETDEPLPPAAVMLCVSRNQRSPNRPLRGHGLDRMGRFAYTRAETADRLALIENALSDPAEGMDVASLEAARRKLSMWAAHLDAGR